MNNQARIPPEISTDRDSLLEAIDEYLTALDVRHYKEAFMYRDRLRMMLARADWQDQQTPNPPDPMDGADHAYEVQNDY